MNMERIEVKDIKCGDKIRLEDDGGCYWTAIEYTARSDEDNYGWYATRHELAYYLMERKYVLPTTPGLYTIANEECYEGYESKRIFRLYNCGDWEEKTDGSIDHSETLEEFLMRMKWPMVRLVPEGSL